MPNASEYLDLNALENLAEVLPEEIESADYVATKTMPVGNYISQSRKITAKRNTDGHFTFTLVHEGGLQYADNGGKVYAARFPLRKWISTKPYRKGDDSQGMTSGVAEYLRACGFNPKGMDLTAIIGAMNESQTIPVSLFVGRTDKRVKNEATGEWTGAEPPLKTRDFITGADDEGKKVFGEAVTRDGKTFFAAPTILSYSTLR